MKYRVIFNLLLFAALLAQTALADQPKVGQVQTCQGAVVAVLGETKRPLVTDSPVYASETLVTGAESRVQLMLADGTVLAMDAQSMLELRDFAYQPGNAENGKVDLNMIVGGLHFLTGQIVRYNDQAFNVETPLGLIGIRGTEGTASTTLSNQADFAASLNAGIAAPGSGWSLGVRPDVRSQSVAHVDGSVEKVMTFSDKFGKRVDLARGQAVDVSRESGAGEPRGLTPADRQVVKDMDFSTHAPAPTPYRSAFGGYSGGGRPSANTVDVGGSTSHDTENSSSGHSH